MRRVVPFLAVCLCLFRSNDALAWSEQEPDATPQGSASAPVRKYPTRFDDQHFGIEARAGFGTDVGLIGIVAEYTPIDWITVGGGIGDNPWGVIGGVHARFRLYEPQALLGLRRALTLEVGYSRGRYSTLPWTDVFASLCEGSPSDVGGNCYRPNVTPEVVNWGQVELGWETRHRSGISFRPAIGIATLLGQPEWKCTVESGSAPCVAGKLPVPTTVVLSLALGFWPG
jgi:hypothetical protein